MARVHKSFIREILKVTQDPRIISFAGGLPNPLSFPVREIEDASRKVLRENGASALQYSTTEGHLPLREIIARRYAACGLHVRPEEIMVTSGSQQGIDLIGKIFIDCGDKVLVERPTYLATLQALGLYQPVFRPVALLDGGVDVDALARALDAEPVKLFYAVPSFQNPTGITYSARTRAAVAALLQPRDTVLIEDNPYGEIRFMGADLPPIKSLLPDGVLLGSFSKIVAPGLRLGWIVAGPAIMEKLIIAKQAADLHTNFFTQLVVHRYLSDNDVDAHIVHIRAMYKRQRDLMVAAMEAQFPPEVQFTRPEGGMFLWVTLPVGISSMELFERALKENVAFVPGQAFYAGDAMDNTLRINFSNSSEEKISEGIARLARSLRELMAQKRSVISDSAPDSQPHKQSCNLS